MSDKESASAGARSKSRRDGQKTGVLTIPKLYITSDEDGTPPCEINVFPESLSRPRTYGRDEDAASTAPLLDSGSTTPIVEEPLVPLTLSSLLANDKLEAHGTSTFQEIKLRSMDDKHIDIGLSDGNSDLPNMPNYAFVHWNWKVLRTMFLVTIVGVLLGCLGYSAGTIIRLPSQCDPVREWWQGRIFYEIFPASFYDSGTDGVGDIKGVIHKLDYIQKVVLVDGIRLNSIYQATNYPEEYLNIENSTNIDPRLGSLTDFQNLVAELEARNMSVILDLHVNRLNISEVPTTLKFWLSHGSHGFFLKGLSHFAQEKHLWKTVAEWKTIVDSFSSGVKRRILLTDSQFLSDYENHHKETYKKMVKQFDLVEHYIDLQSSHSFPQQVAKVLNLDNDVNNPWIMWSFGGAEKPRLTSKLCQGLPSCQISSLGALFLLSSLPGSVNLFYGDEIGLLDYVDENSTRDVQASPLSSLAIMRWTGGIYGGFTSPTALPWQSVGRSVENNNVNCMNLSLSRWQSFIRIRRSSVPLQVDAILKFDEGSLTSKLPNYQLHSISNSTLLIERFYPRRHRYLVVSHLDTKKDTVDMSSIFFGGRVLVSSNGAKEGYIPFKGVTMEPVEAAVFQLDK